MNIIDVGVEECPQRVVSALVRMRRAGSWTVAPGASVRLFNLAEPPLRRPSEGSVDRERDEE